MPIFWWDGAGIDDRNYRFPHRTFQEYLAACQLAAGRLFLRQAAELAAEGDTWREVLNLAAGTLVFNQNNREKALDGVEKVLPRRTPAANNEAGWFRVWLGDPRPDVACEVPFMIEIPAGPFLMGSKKDMADQAFDDEEPQHQLDLPAYKISKYPVTVWQFERFVEAGGYKEAVYWTEAGWQRQQQEKWTAPRYWDDSRRAVPNHPVVGVSWYEAVAYCSWLKAMTGRDLPLSVEVARRVPAPLRPALLAQLFGVPGGRKSLRSCILTAVSWILISCFSGPLSHWRVRFGAGDLAVQNSLRPQAQRSLENIQRLLMKTFKNLYPQLTSLTNPSFLPSCESQTVYLSSIKK